MTEWRDPEDDEREPLIGYAFGFKNAELGVDMFGSPHELLEEMCERGVVPGEIAVHRQTEIDAREIFKPGPDLRFSGGPHAEAVLELIEAVDEADLQRVAAIVARDPAVLTGAHDGAAIPLLVAVASGRLEAVDVVELLLTHRAAVDGTTHFGMSPLHWAAVLGDLEIAKRLLAAGADTNRMSWFLATPYELALLNEHEAVAAVIADRQRAGDSFSMQVVLGRMGISIDN